MDDLRSWWEVPSIAHFCSLFRTAFDLTDFDIEDLEEALIDSEKEEGNEFILDLVCRLLNGCYARKDISVANYDLYVKDIIKYKWDASDNPIKEKSEFKALALREKVEFILAVCEYRLDTEDVVEQLKGFEGDSMRVEPLGKDKDGATYWYFYGSRLYKEDPKPKKELTKPEKKAKDKQHAQDLKRKKKEEKRQHKEEKRQLRESRRERKRAAESKAQTEVQEESGNIRRSGRIRSKKVDTPPPSSSSESSSSSSDEEEESEDESPVEEQTEGADELGKEEQSKPAVSPGKGRRGRGKRNTNTPAQKNTPVKKQTPVKKETPATKGTRSRRGRQSDTPKQGSSAASTPQSEASSRRSSRLRRNKNDLPLPSPHYDSDTEGEADSGNESAGSGRSELSKSQTSAGAVKSSRRPTGKLSLTRDTSRTDGVVDEEAMETENTPQDADNEETPDRQEDDSKTTPTNNTDVGHDTEGETMDTDAGQSEEKPVIDDDKDKLTDQIETKQESTITDNKPKMEHDKCDMITSENVSEVNEKEPAANSEGKVDVSESDTVEIKEEIIETKEEKMETDENGDNDEKQFASRRSQRIEKNKIVTEEKVTEEINEESEMLAAMKQKVMSPKPAVEPTASMSSTRWHMVCATLDDWINLAEWFKDSPVRCEKALSKVIMEDFLPVLPEIIEAREKERLKKLQDLDVRRSNRITQKMRDKMESERILAEALADEEKMRIKVEEERKLKEEQLRLEEENKQREERRKAREERTKRLSMREERSRLLAEGKEIPPELLYTGASTQKYKDDDDSDDSRCDLKDEEDYQGLMKVLSAMKYHKDCWPFLEPVTDEQAPGYSDVIKRPMDLSKIEHKVESREYRSTQHFLSDFRLMFNNCKRFNGQDSDFSDCARSMEQMLKKYTKRFLKDEPTDKYYQDKDFHMGMTRAMQRNCGDKKYRPRRAASTRAMETVHKALNSDDEEESEDDEDEGAGRSRGKNMLSPIKTPSHHNLLLQEMIELKRQREKKLAASALQNHQVITRGPERIRLPNPHGGGVMIMPKEDLQPSGVLRMAATREIKRKVNPGYAQVGSVNPAVVHAGATKRDPSLNIIDHSVPGSKQPKTIRIVAGGTGQASVKETAESVKVSADGFLIIGGKNSGIKVSENTKIVIQPQSAVTAKPGQQATGQLGQPRFPGQSGAAQLAPVTSVQQAMSREVIIKKVNATGSPDVKMPEINNLAGNQSAGMSQVPATMSVSGGSQPTASTIQNIVGQAAGGVGNQAINPELQKKLDIAQRIMVLGQHKKRYLEQQQKQQQQAASPAKVMKLDTAGSSGQADHRSIEERLRDPSLNIDNQLGSVSQNVLSNVNIASDILDTYYSVLNESKPNVQKPVQTVKSTQPVSTLNTPSSVNTSGITSPNIQGPGINRGASNILSSPLQSPGLGNLSPGTAGILAGNFGQQVIEMLKNAKMSQLQQQQAQSVSGVSPMIQSQSVSGVSPMIQAQSVSGVSPMLQHVQSVSGISPMIQAQSVSGINPVLQQQIVQSVSGVSPMIQAPSMSGISPIMQQQVQSVSGVSPMLQQQHVQSVSGISPMLQQQSQPQLASTTGPILRQQVPQSVVPDNTVKALSSVTQMLTGGTSISDLLKNALIKGQLQKLAQMKVKTDSAGMTPIEALLRTGSQSVTSPASVSINVQPPPIVQTSSLHGGNVPASVSQLNSVGQVNLLNPANIQTSSIQPATVQITSIQSGIQPVNVQQSGIQALNVQQTGLLPSSLQQSGIPSGTVQTSGILPSGILSPSIQQIGILPSSSPQSGIQSPLNIQQSGIQSPLNMQQSGIQSPLNIQQSGIHSPLNIQQSGMFPTSFQQSSIQPMNIQLETVPSSTIQQTGIPAMIPPTNSMQQQANDLLKTLKSGLQSGSLSIKQVLEMASRTQKVSKDLQLQKNPVIPATQNVVINSANVSQAMGVQSVELGTSQSVGLGTSQCLNIGNQSPNLGVNINANATVQSPNIGLNINANATVQSPNIGLNIDANATVQSTNISNSFMSASETSPNKIDRQNLFDMFDTDKVSSSSSVDASPTKEDPNFKAKKELIERLKAAGVRAPAASTVNFGSPLKTASVMEALKSKLHNVKPDAQCACLYCIASISSDSELSCNAPSPACPHLPVVRSTFRDSYSSLTNTFSALTLVCSSPGMGSQHTDKLRSSPIASGTSFPNALLVGYNSAKDCSKSTRHHSVSYMCNTLSERCSTPDRGCSTSNKNCTTPDRDCSTPDGCCSKTDRGCSTPDRGCSKTDRGCCTPDRGCGTPDRGCDTPDRGCSTPDRGCSTLDRGCSTPDRDCSTPGRDCSTPDRGCSTPDRGCSTPDRDCSTPGRDCGTPDRGCGTPDRDCGTPDRGHSTPDRGCSAPDRGCSTPDRDCGTPDRGCSTPGRDCSTLDRGCGTLDRGCSTPDRGCNTPDRDCGTPDRGCSKLDRGCSTHYRGCSTPNKGCSKPDRGCSTPDRGCGTPDRGCSTPDRGCSKPNTGCSTPDRGCSTPGGGITCSELPVLNCPIINIAEEIEHENQARINVVNCISTVRDYDIQKNAIDLQGEINHESITEKLLPKSEPGKRGKSDNTQHIKSKVRKSDTVHNEHKVKLDSKQGKPSGKTTAIKHTRAKDHQSELLALRKQIQIKRNSKNRKLNIVNKIQVYSDTVSSKNNNRKIDSDDLDTAYIDQKHMSRNSLQSYCKSKMKNAELLKAKENKMHAMNSNTRYEESVREGRNRNLQNSYNERFDHDVTGSNFGSEEHFQGSFRMENDDENVEDSGPDLEHDLLRSWLTCEEPVTVECGLTNEEVGFIEARQVNRNWGINDFWDSERGMAMTCNNEEIVTTIQNELSMHSRFKQTDELLGQNETEKMIFDDTESEIDRSNQNEKTSHIGVGVITTTGSGNESRKEISEKEKDLNFSQISGTREITVYNSDAINVKDSSQKLRSLIGNDTKPRVSFCTSPGSSIHHVKVPLLVRSRVQKVNYCANTSELPNNEHAMEYPMTKISPQMLMPHWYKERRCQKRGILPTVLKIPEPCIVQKPSIAEESPIVQESNNSTDIESPEKLTTIRSFHISRPPYVHSETEKQKQKFSQTKICRSPVTDGQFSSLGGVSIHKLIEQHQASMKIRGGKNKKRQTQKHSKNKKSVLIKQCDKSQKYKQRPYDIHSGDCSAMNNFNIVPIDMPDNARRLVHVSNQSSNSDLYTCDMDQHQYGMESDFSSRLVHVSNQSSNSDLHTCDMDQYQYEMESDFSEVLTKCVCVNSDSCSLPMHACSTCNPVVTASSDNSSVCCGTCMCGMCDFNHTNNYSSVGGGALDNSLYNVPPVQHIDKDIFELQEKLIGLPGVAFGTTSDITADPSIGSVHQIGNYDNHQSASQGNIMADLQNQVMLGNLNQDQQNQVLLTSKNQPVVVSMAQVSSEQVLPTVVAQLNNKPAVPVQRVQIQTSLPMVDALRDSSQVTEPVQANSLMQESPLNSENMPQNLPTYMGQDMDMNSQPAESATVTFQCGDESEILTATPLPSEFSTAAVTNAVSTNGSQQFVTGTLTSPVIQNIQPQMYRAEPVTQNLELVSDQMGIEHNVMQQGVNDMGNSVTYLSTANISGVPSTHGLIEQTITTCDVSDLGLVQMNSQNVVQMNSQNVVVEGIVPVMESNNGVGYSMEQGDISLQEYEIPADNTH